MSNENTIATSKSKQQARRIGTFALMMVMLFTLTVQTGVLPAFAATQNDTLNAVMQQVVDLVTTASLYIGIVIVIWGIFQVIMAFRREDSEAISKQFMTIAVGAILVTFGAFAEGIITSLLQAGTT